MKPITLKEALDETLRQHPLLESQRWEVESARGAQRQAAGEFDTVVLSTVGQQQQDVPLSQFQRGQLPTPLQQVSDSVITTTGYGSNVSRLFRNGVSVNSYMNLSRSRDNTDNLAGSSTSQMGLLMIVPLLRNRGFSVPAANEAAAGIEITSRQLDLQQARDQLLANTAMSYWHLVAAKHRLSVAAGSEDRGRLLLETVRALIAADRLPNIDINEVTANLSDRVASRIAAEQEVAQSRVQLGLAMGLSPGALLEVGDPAEEFPSIDGSIGAWDDGSLLQYVQQSEQSRADLEAAARREEQARLLYLASKNSIRPQFNLQFGAGYTQLRENGSAAGFFSSAFASLHRPDFQAGIVYQFAYKNSIAQGQLLQAQAKLREAVLQRSELRRQITAAVSIAWSNVRNSVLRLRSSNDAVEAFQRTLDGEREKFTFGQSSLTELLTVEDRLTAALSRQVDAQESYVVSLAGLRLATGTLFPLSGKADGVEDNVFITAPRF